MMANVIFNPNDFTQVGQINVQPDIQSISITNTDVRLETPQFDTTQYGIDLLGDAIGLVSDNLSTVYSGLQSINNAVQSSSASSVSDIANAFSLVDTSKSEESLQKITDSTAKLSSALSSADIQAPLLKLYFDAAVSQQARNEISQGLASYQALEGKLEALDASLQHTYSDVQALSTSAYNASNAAVDLSDALLPLGGLPGAYSRLVGLIASVDTLRDLGEKADNTGSKISAVLDSLHSIEGKVQDNINAYQSALSTPLVPSIWTTSATIQGAQSAFFTADFTSNTFNTPGSDSPGEFLVGTLSIHNFVTPGGGDSILDGSIDFTLNQHIEFAGISNDISGSSSTTFQYVATQNTDDPVASADGFYISSLGVSLAIEEDTTATFLVYGSVNSPFQISRIVSNDSNGFVTSDINYVPTGSSTIPPIASSDNYELKENSVLTVTSNGLLSNDSSSSGDQLTSALVSKPEHGSLIVNSDGSFVYVPDFGYVGSDSFTYLAKDGSLPSSPATVTLTVDAPLPSHDVSPIPNSGSIASGASSNILVVHDASNPSGAIFALYEGLLGHAPDTAGAQSWVAALNAGTSLHDVTQAILSSPEAQSHINASDNAGFVEQLYETVLGHQADPDGAHSWVAALDAGTTTRADVADAFVFSDEHGAQLQPALNAGVPVTDPGVVSAERLYFGLLDRAPDQTGLQNISDALAHGGSLQDVAQNILTSAEYTSAHPQMSDGQYVEALYENLLGRTGDAASANSWTAALANGTDWASVANAFLDSAEFQNQYANQSSAAYVEALYEHVLGHTGDAATVQSLASQIDSYSLSRIDVANSFTTTAEFQSHYPGSGDAGFIESLYHDALGRAPDAAGEQSWLYALSHGTSRADVALQIVDSPEAQQHLAAQVGAGLHVA